MIYGMQYLHSNKNWATTLSITTLSKMGVFASLSVYDVQHDDTQY
jgi:hypothetical protein